MKYFILLVVLVACASQGDFSNTEIPTKERPELGVK